MPVFSTPAGATPMPSSPNKIVTGDETVAPSIGLIIYTRVPTFDSMASSEYTIIGVKKMKQAVKSASFKYKFLNICSSLKGLI